MNKLLTLYRLKRKWEVKTLDGYKPLYPYAKKMCNLLTEEIDVYCNKNFRKFKKK